ncbi:MULTISPECIES: hypothetical protein [Paenibacillus]|uniref:hypothetical protein n=1 Tax=Paenibacillus TaxID=44249 RepID=UPI0022B8D475|nr:hypothetical protein [Paenibacillus caseinilyticus]MCZ8523088.1 hypothetical protein [Paenibacillus caseinilyticus]
MFISPFGWFMLLLWTVFPLYVIFRLESISRRLRRMETGPRDSLRSDLRAHNARVLEEWEQSQAEEKPLLQERVAEQPAERPRQDEKS